MEKLIATPSVAGSVVGVVTSNEKAEILAASLTADASLSATLSASNAITAQLSVENSLSAALTVPDLNPDIQVYNGEYVVIPKVESQKLETANKLMRANVTVKEIPYYETTNESGGYTVIIG